MHSGTSAVLPLHLFLGLGSRRLPSPAETSVAYKDKRISSGHSVTAPELRHCI